MQRSGPLWPSISTGPDLRTRRDPRVLFEIKSELEASDLQRGLGQLLLYEAMLEMKHSKVLVLPNEPPGEVEKPLSKMGIQIVKFSRAGGKIKFDRKL